ARPVNPAGLSTRCPAFLRRRIRLLLCGFIGCLILSGLTALPLPFEVSLLGRLLDVRPASMSAGEGLRHWIATVGAGLRETNVRYPFLAYGTDWLAFAHLAIAVAFFGPLRDPVRNAWVVTFGLIACAGVIPMALIAGSVRGIPLAWRLIDCGFSLLGAIPLLVCRADIRQLEALGCASGE